MAEEVFEEATTQTAQANWFGAESAIRYGQVFTPESSTLYELHSIAIAGNGNWITAECQCYFGISVSNNPNNGMQVALKTHTSLTQTPVSGGYWNTWDFSDLNYYIFSGVQYYFAGRRVASGAPTIQIFWAGNGQYARGVYIYSNDNGGSWTVNPGSPATKEDLRFQVWGTPIEGGAPVVIAGGGMWNW